MPGDWLVESKSLKLYLVSFRNHGAFHEDCTVRDRQGFVALLKPEWLRIGGYWYPRGGIPIDVFWQTGAPPAGVWVPDQGVPVSRARAWVSAGNFVAWFDRECGALRGHFAPRCKLALRNARS